MLIRRFITFCLLEYAIFDHSSAMYNTYTISLLALTQR